MKKIQHIQEVNIEEIQSFNNESSHTRILPIIRGVVKKELIRRLENHNELFPLQNKMSLHFIHFYIIKKSFSNVSLMVQNSILANAKKIHRKEIRRIQKAIRTIEENIETILPQKIASPLLDQITRYVIYQWLKKEFYISKEEIRRFIYGFSVFYPELRPKNDSK